MRKHERTTKWRSERTKCVSIRFFKWIDTVFDACFEAQFHQIFFFGRTLSTQTWQPVACDKHFIITFQTKQNKIYTKIHSINNQAYHNKCNDRIKQKKNGIFIFFHAHCRFPGTADRWAYASAHHPRRAPFTMIKNTHTHQRSIGISAFGVLKWFIEHHPFQFDICFVDACPFVLLFFFRVRGLCFPFYTLSQRLRSRQIEQCL